MKEVKRNLRYFLFTGFSWSVFDALTVAFLTVFALALGASNTVVGLLSAVTYLAAFAAELPGARLLDLFPKKELVAWTGLVARLGWLLMAFVPFLFSSHPLVWIVCVFAFIRFVELLGDPGWTALVADIVPERKRGVFFGKRNMLIGLGGLGASVVGGVYLDLFPKDSFVGFSSLFVVGVLWSMLTFYCVMQIKEPRESHIHHLDGFSFSPVLWRFSLVSVVFYFSVMLASPFFAVYMLKKLGLSYTWFVVAGGIATLARIAAQKHLGVVADRMGDHHVALVCMLGTAFVPLSYIFITPSTWFLIIPAQIFSGIVWAGVDLAVFNLLLDYTDRVHRAAQSAAFNMMLSVSNIAGPLIGGLVADSMSVLMLGGIPLVFAISTVLRGVSALLLVSLPEVRAKKNYSLGIVLKEILSLHPSKGFEMKIVSAVKSRVK